MNSSGNLTVSGCTFYNNKCSAASNRGGAIYFSGSGKTLTLTGNLFYGNTAINAPVVSMSNGTTSSTYNVVDVAYGTTDAGLRGQGTRCSAH
jgi:hypothetical protein